VPDATRETWRPIAGWDDSYQVSDLGRVRSIPRLNNYGRRLRGRLLKPGTRADGHLVVILCVNRVKTTRQVHQLVLEAFAGPRPAGLEGLHDNGNPADNARTNLRYGTHAENMRDAVRHGTNRNAAKTHCPQNHEYTPENTYAYGNARQCRECALARARASKAARRSQSGASA
jgi:hypothetical protein